MTEWTTLCSLPRWPLVVAHVVTGLTLLFFAFYVWVTRNAVQDLATHGLSDEPSAASKGIADKITRYVAKVGGTSILLHKLSRLASIVAFLVLTIITSANKGWPTLDIILIEATVRENGNWLPSLI
jgi:ABC-type Fe3+-siderophore transport system permease subunit